MTGFAGVAPAMLRMAADGDGLVRNSTPWWRRSCWPTEAAICLARDAADAPHFRENHDGLVPPGILDTVVPAAPDTSRLAHRPAEVRNPQLR